MAKKPDEKIKLQMSGTAPQKDYAANIRKAPEYRDAYKAQRDELLHKVLDRPAFSYDAESDPLYQQYKEQYRREGERAMKNTLGEVSARTGGLASSYAVGAAQEANDYYNAQLADKIPELWELAYSMYLGDGKAQREDLALLQDMSDTAYGRYRDTMDDWYSERDFAYDAYRDTLDDDRYAAEWDYTLTRDALDDEWRQKEWDYRAAQSAKASSGKSGGSGGEKDPTLAWIAKANKLDYEDVLNAQAANTSLWGAMLEKAGVSMDESAAIADTESGDAQPSVSATEAGSALALGYGPVSEATLAALIRRGEVEMYVDGGKVRFKRVQTGVK